MSEKLSAFLDNELSEFEERRLLKELGSDKELRDAWGRYHVIRAALRGELETVTPTALSERVAERIENEAPQRRAAAPLSWRKAVAGSAIAAGVAAVAVYSLQTPTTAPMLSEVRAPAAEVATVATTAQPAGAQAPSPSPMPTNPLNAYLVEHSEFAPTAGVGGLLPYVRTVNDSGR